MTSTTVRRRAGSDMVTVAPPVAGQIERFVLSHGAKYGFARYWDAEALTWETQLHIQAYPAYNCNPPTLVICPFVLNTISSWYEPRLHTRTFLVVDATGPDPLAADPASGHPIAAANFGDVSVYVYNHDIAATMQEGQLSNVHLYLASQEGVGRTLLPIYRGHVLISCSDLQSHVLNCAWCIHPTSIRQTRLEAGTAIGGRSQPLMLRKFRVRRDLISNTTFSNLIDLITAHRSHHCSSISSLLIDLITVAGETNASLAMLSLWSQAKNAVRYFARPEIDLLFRNYIGAYANDVAVPLWIWRNNRYPPIDQR